MEANVYIIVLMTAEISVITPPSVMLKNKTLQFSHSGWVSPLSNQSPLKLSRLKNTVSGIAISIYLFLINADKASVMAEKKIPAKHLNMDNRNQKPI